MYQHLKTFARLCSIKYMAFLRANLKFCLKRLTKTGCSQNQTEGCERLLLEARDAVIDFILSYGATESHCRRARSGWKKYFDSNILMHQMWSQFVREQPHLMPTSLFKNKNKGRVISFSTFRNTFNRELKDVLSLRTTHNPQFLDSLRRASARNVSFRISLRWPIHIINPVDKTKLSCNTPTEAAPQFL